MLTRPPLGQIPPKYFSGGSHLADGELAALLNEAARADTTRIFHEPIVTASRATSAPGQGPSPIVLGTLIGLEFSGALDAAYRMIRIDAAHDEVLSTFHVHWSKSTNVDESGKTIRWRITYVVFDGIAQDVIVSPTVALLDDTYDDNGTTSRIVYRTPAINTVGFTPGYYLGLCIDIDPAGTTLVGNPVLAAVDLRLSLAINS